MYIPILWSCANLTKINTMDIDFDCNQHLGFRVALWSNFGGCVKIKIPNNFLEEGLCKVIQFNHIRNGKTCGMQIKRTIQSMSYEMSKYNSKDQLSNMQISQLVAYSSGGFSQQFVFWNLNNENVLSITSYLCPQANMLSSH